MIIFFYFFFIFFLFFEMSHIFEIFGEFNYNLNVLFIHFYTVILAVNFFSLPLKNHYHISLNLDLLIKYVIFLIKTPNFFFNYVLNIFKKIFLYLFFFKYMRLLRSLYLFYKKNYNSFYVLWRPLFKKSSYFGYYRSNRSKWIK